MCATLMTQHASGQQKVAQACIAFGNIHSLVMPTLINTRLHFPWWVKTNSFVSFFHPLQNNESKIELAQMGTLCALRMHLITL